MLYRLICGLLITASLFTGFISNVYAEGLNCNFTKKTMVFFVNGMFNSDEDVIYSKSAVKKMTRQILIDNPNLLGYDATVGYDHLRNHNENIFTQFTQVYEQRELIEDEKTLFENWIIDKRGKPAWVDDEVYNSVQELIAKKTRYFEKDTDFYSMLSRVLACLEAGMRVILVAHSQGNMYANELYAEIARYHGEYANSVGIVNVASPDSRFNNFSAVATARQDNVINFVRAFYSDTQEGTFDLKAKLLDFMNHSFTKRYMTYGEDSYGLIYNNIKYYLTNLEYPENTITQDGVITIRLDWGADQDVDLHVQEPGNIGKHVYYSDKHGAFGDLDVDNISGFGPEHYNVQCASLATGTYKFGAVYYRGYGEALYTIAVSANGKEDFSGLRTLSTATRSSEGQYIGEIQVTEDESGNADFNIIFY
ncbi:MAG: hypothetical protein GY793_00470 [Proteobacteria bacterium]|nr:hypothetical protein [Pseudomonadota bacterium]